MGRATACLFLKNSVIWERVVINFQNPLPSPTFHTAPLLTALWFFRQDLRALIKPGALLTPTHARTHADAVFTSVPYRDCATAFACPCTSVFWLSGKVAVDTSG